MVLNFENEFRLSTAALRFIAVHPDCPRGVKWLIQIISFNSLCLTVIYFLSYSIIYHDILDAYYGKSTEAIQNGSLVIVSVSMPYYNYLAIRYRKHLKKYMNIIDEDLTAVEEYKREDKEIVLKYSKMATDINKYWFHSVTVAASMFPLRALYLTLLSYVKGDFKFVHMFIITYPEWIEIHRYNFWVDFALFSLYFIFVIYGTIIYVAFDPLIPIFVLQICGQIELLSERLLVLAENTDENDIIQNFKTMNTKLQGLYRFIDSLKSNFVILFEYQMKITIFLVPFALFQIFQSLYRLEVNVKFITFLFSCLIRFFLSCYYGDMLVDKGNKLRTSIYCCGWEKHCNIQIRKTVLLMLTRCNNPPSIRSVFYPVNLETFSETCRQAYAIFNIMNAAWS